MPGGSVNGRPFRDSPNSYSRCGVPCGHPDRYSTSSVVRVGVTVRPKGRVTLDGPLENIETEGERQLKQLAKRQTETQLNLQEHMSRHRSFTEKVVYKPKTAEVKGVKSLQDYNKIRQQVTPFLFTKMIKVLFKVNSYYFQGKSRRGGA